MESTLANLDPHLLLDRGTFRPGPHPLSLVQTHRRRQATSSLDPRGETDDPLSSCRIIGDYQDHRTPVAVVLDRVAHGEKSAPNILEECRPTSVGPAGRVARSLHILVNPHQHGGCHRPCGRVDGEHRTAAGKTTRQAQPGVVSPKPRPERRTGGTRLVVGRIVHQPVGDQKEHRHDRGDEVQVPEDHRDDRDCEREQHRAAGIARLRGHLGERGEESEQLVGGQGLQDTRSAEERRERRGEGGREEPPAYKPGNRRHSAHGVIVPHQVGPRD